MFFVICHDFGGFMTKKQMVEPVVAGVHSTTKERTTRIKRSGLLVKEAAAKSASHKHRFVGDVTSGRITGQNTLMDEVRVAKAGIEVAGVEKFATDIGWNNARMARSIGVSTRTFLRHKETQKPLDVKTSQNAIAVAKLSDAGVEYFGSDEQWNLWLDTPHIQFDKQPPKDVIDTIQGRELINRIIMGLEHGFTA